MTLNPNDTRRPSVQVAEAIQRDITAGTYPPGSQIPSVPDLAEKYAVAKQTAHNAVKLLQEQGIVVSRIGQGTFVRTDTPASQPTLAELADKIHELEQRLTAVEEQHRQCEP